MGLSVDIRFSNACTTANDFSRENFSLDRLTLTHTSRWGIHIPHHRVLTASMLISRLKGDMVLGEHGHKRRVQEAFDVIHALVLQKPSQNLPPFYSILRSHFESLILRIQQAPFFRPKCAQFRIQLQLQHERDCANLLKTSTNLRPVIFGIFKAETQTAHLFADWAKFTEWRYSVLYITIFTKWSYANCKDRIGCDKVGVHGLIEWKTLKWVLQIVVHPTSCDI